MLVEKSEIKMDVIVIFVFYTVSLILRRYTTLLSLAPCSMS